MEYKSLGDYFYYTQAIGQGSFSTIYRGFRLKDKHPVAIKKLTRIVDNKYIESEIDLMKSLDCDNILKLYEVIRRNDKVYLILEYCNQSDLSDYIRSQDNALNNKFIYQIINALKYLFKKNIVHRDIKPQNILIHDNTIKICDFGFAKTFKDNDLINTFCGSPLYMAPEILKYSEYSEKADIWSLGVIIYEIITKQHPYPSENKFELIKNLKSDKKIVIPNFIEPSLNNLLTRLLDKNPETRISWSNIFSHEWFLENVVDNNIVNKSRSNSLEPIFSFEEEDHINTDLVASINYSNKKPSVSIPIIAKSHIHKSNEVFIKDYDDSKVYSRSAPAFRSSLYMENYINSNKTINKDQEETNDYKILGSSPNIQSNGGIYDYLNKSVNTIKNLFSM